MPTSLNALLKLRSVENGLPLGLRAQGQKPLPHKKENTVNKKYIFLLLVLITFLTSCITLPKFISGCDYDFENQIPEFKNVQQAAIWVARHLQYKKERGETWQPPEESYKRKKADCEDHVLLLERVVKDKLGIDDLYLVSFYTARGTFHAVAEINGELWESTNGTRILELPGSTKLFKMDYETAICMAVEQKKARDHVKKKLDELK